MEGKCHYKCHQSKIYLISDNPWDAVKLSKLAAPVRAADNSFVDIRGGGCSG